MLNETVIADSVTITSKFHSLPKIVKFQNQLSVTLLFICKETILSLLQPKKVFFAFILSFGNYQFMSVIISYVWVCIN